MAIIGVCLIPKAATIQTNTEQERAILVGVEIKSQANYWPLKESLHELALLVEAAGAKVVGEVTQRLDRPSRMYLGKGKLEYLKTLGTELQYDTVIFDDELIPNQQLSLEKALDGPKVIDRTALILDVFARHASTREGRLQVELAQHQYLLPRLAGQWTHLERLGGGIGTRGPGEAQLETDRRIIQKHIQKLSGRIEQVRRQRAMYRKRRRRAHVPVVSLIGYTNAGKSSLFNAMTNGGVLVQDQLFSTLDPVTRRMRLPRGLNVLITDTVGFIQKLPTKLIAAFRATLEELQEADLLLHVVDVNNTNIVEQSKVVEKILEELKVDNKSRLVVLNKIDLLKEDNDPSATYATSLIQRNTPIAFVSATVGTGLDQLQQDVESTLKGILRADLAQEGRQNSEGRAT